MSQLTERLKSPTPYFFKNLRNWMIAVVVLAGTVITLQETGKISLPEWIQTLSYIIATFGAAMGFTAQMTKK